MNSNIQAELDAWLRPLAPSTVFLRSLRMEDPNHQQQQQQQQPENPFAGIDKTLLDDHTRAQIEKAEASFATVAKDAGEKVKFQSEHDRLKGEYDKLQQQIQQQQQPDPRQQQQQQKNEPASLEDELIEYYVSQGIELKDAVKVAKMNAGMQEIAGKRFMANVDARMLPITATVVDRTATDAFEYVRQNDKLGVFQINEVAQRLWDTTQEMAKSGQPVNAQVVDRLAKIFWAEHIEQNPTALSQQQQQQPNNSGAPIIQTVTRGADPMHNNPQNQFTFPGATNGNHVRTPNYGNGNRGPSTLDADTARAIDLTTNKWPVKPKQPAGAR